MRGLGWLEGHELQCPNSCRTTTSSGTPAAASMASGNSFIRQVWLPILLAQAIGEPLLAPQAEFILGGMPLEDHRALELMIVFQRRQDSSPIRIGLTLCWCDKGRDQHDLSDEAAAEADVLLMIPVFGREICQPQSTL
jgi:hypothetical protein